MARISREEIMASWDEQNFNTLKEILNSRKDQYGSIVHNINVEEALIRTWEQEARSCGNPTVINDRYFSFYIKRVLAKLSRLTNNPNHEDSLFDIMGYTMRYLALLQDAKGRGTVVVDED